MTEIKRNHVLYRFYDDTDNLLYVGITVNLTRRIEKHKTEKDWWPEVSRIGIEHFADRQTVLSAERAAIENEKPCWHHSNDYAGKRQELLWVNGKPKLP